MKCSLFSATVAFTVCSDNSPNKFFRVNEQVGYMWTKNIPFCDRSWIVILADKCERVNVRSMLCVELHVTNSEFCACKYCAHAYAYQPFLYISSAEGREKCSEIGQIPFTLESDAFLMSVLCWLAIHTEVVANMHHPLLHRTQMSCFQNYAAFFRPLQQAKRPVWVAIPSLTQETPPPPPFNPSLHR